MRKKRLFIITIGILLITITSIIKIYSICNLDMRTKKQEISNSVVEYLLISETFKEEVPEEVEVKYDSTLEMYIVSVKFENNLRKATVIVSDENEIKGILQ
jgi:hypothetical protein